jgi:hypothetical protein
MGEIADPEMEYKAGGIVFIENTCTLAKRGKMSEHEAYS